MLHDCRPSIVVTKSNMDMHRIAVIVFKKITFITILTSLLLLAGCSKTRSEKVRIGYIPFNADLPFFVSQEKGYFIEEGIKVDALRFGDSGQAMNAMLAKQIDLVAGLTFSIFFSAEQESPGKFKLIIPFAEVKSKLMSALVVGPDAKIKSLSDLKGKKIGTYSGPTQLLYLKLFIKKIGLNPDKDITILQVASDLQVQALLAKQFDALFTVEPYGTIAIQQGAGKILLENPRYHYITAPFWSGATGIDSEFCHKHLGTVGRIYKALAKAVDFINNQETEAKRILAKYTPLDESTALKSGLYKWFKVEESIDYSSVQKIADYMYEYKLLNKQLDAKELFLTAKELE